MKALLFCGLCFLFIGGAYADDGKAGSKDCPVTIKILQADTSKGEFVQVQVTNSSTQSVVVDQEALQQPDFMVSKDVTENSSKDTRELMVTGASNGSVGGRWTVAQLQRREPERLATISPGETVTVDVPISKLLSGIDKTFPHGTIELRLTFHDFLLAVDGKDTTAETFNARVEAVRAKINWR